MLSSSLTSASLSCPAASRSGWSGSSLYTFLGPFSLGLGELIQRLSSVSDLAAEDRERCLEFPRETEVSKPPKCMEDARQRVSWLAAWRWAPHYANFWKGFLRGVQASEVEGKNRQSPGRDRECWVHRRHGSVSPEGKAQGRRC